MITLARIIGLAFADSINPFAFAVMTMVLVSIMLSNPENKKTPPGKRRGDKNSSRVRCPGKDLLYTLSG